MSEFSHSRIQAFETCPKKYEFTYILREPRGPSGIEAFMGSRVHDALEWLYDQVCACRLPGVEDVVGRYLERWDAEWSDDVAVVRSDRTADDYKAIGEKAVRDYYRRYHPFDQGTTVGLEQRVSFALDEQHAVMGFIDRLTKVTDHLWEIHDYKTSRTLMTQDKADLDRQLALYHLAVREMYPDAEHVDLVWHYLVFDQEVRSSRTPEQLEALRRELLEQIRHIEAQTSFPTSRSRLCDWCDYQQICPAHGHVAEIAESPEDPFAEETTTSLVDRYAELSEGIGRMQDERDRLRQALVGRAGLEQGPEWLDGTERSIRVSRYQSASLPDARDPRRAELEEVLRSEGLLEKYSQLSTTALSKDLCAHRVPPEVLDRIGPFVTFSPGVRLTTSRRDTGEECSDPGE